MKKSLYIFIYIFLFGMIFTVVQYVPLLEEESPHAKTEFFKKVKDSSEGDGSEDGDPDSDPDSSPTEGIVSAFDLHWSEILSREGRYETPSGAYQSIIEGITTPPPRS